MKRKIATLTLLAFFLFGCMWLTPQPTPSSEHKTPEPYTPTVPGDTPTDRPPQRPSPAPLTEPNPNLVSFNVDLAAPFFELPLLSWESQPYAGEGDALPVTLDAIANPDVIRGLTDAQRKMLSVNGFTVLQTQEKQFSDIRKQVADENGQPYYLTTDSAYHAMHIHFDELLKLLERQQFRPQTAQLLSGLLAQVQTYQAGVQGTTLEADTELAAAYLAVAVKLIDPQLSVPADLSALVNPQIEQITAGAGRAESTLIPDFEDDYGAYKPVGHYTSHPDLEHYFRAMTWMGRVAFQFQNPDRPDAVPSRVPLIITLALREARLSGDVPAANIWSELHEVLTFLVGPSDDPGPLELSILMDQVYGPGITINALADEDRWQDFLTRVDELPAPQINSTFASTTQTLEASRDWRLMGQRFTLDGLIFQNMIYDKVGSNDNRREFPSGLDVMAAFGSPNAAAALEAAGVAEYANFESQLVKMQQTVQAQPENEWLNRFYSAWLYAFIPQVASKGEAFPPFMRTDAWGYKDLNSALGSWAELKHDTALYNKMPEFMGGGGPPSSGPPPGYVEPNPDVFYRLGYLATSLYEGLMMRNMTSVMESALDSDDNPYALESLVYDMSGMGERFQLLGDIAVKELRGEALSEEDRYVVTSCIGSLGCGEAFQPEADPVPVIAAVSGANDDVLEVGVGYVDRIYVVVPIDGSLQVAQGGVFSYYEFTQPRSKRLTDEGWRERLTEQAPDRPEWVNFLSLPGGESNDTLAFRVNDIYIITEAGGSPPLNMRTQPSTTATVAHKLSAGAYVRIIDGPVQAGGNTWWKIQEEFDGSIGWVAENPEWYERAHGQ